MNRPKQRDVRRASEILTRWRVRHVLLRDHMTGWSERVGWERFLEMREHHELAGLDWTIVEGE